MELADIFIQEFLLAEFDKKPLELQALEVKNMKERHDLFNKRYIKNSGSLGGAPKKHSNETIEFILEEIKAIQNTDDYKRRKRRNETDITAYIMLVEKVLSNPETEQLFIEKKWLSAY